jgi:hypothetical protein
MIACHQKVAESLRFRTSWLLLSLQLGHIVVLLHVVQMDRRHSALRSE